MAGLAWISAPNLIPEPPVIARDMFDMAAFAQMITGLFQKMVVFTAMRLMASNAAVAVNRIGNGRFMFVGEWAALVLMAGFANTTEIVGKPIILLLHESVAVKAGYVSLQDRMVGTAAELGADGCMAAKAKLGFIVHQLPLDRSMDFMALAALHLLHRMHVKTEIIQFIMPGMTFRAELYSILAGEIGRIGDIFFRRVLNMFPGAIVTANACDHRGGFGYIRCQPVWGRGQSFIHPLVTLQASLIVDDILSGYRGRR